MNHIEFPANGMQLSARGRKSRMNQKYQVRSIHGFVKRLYYSVRSGAISIPVSRNNNPEFTPFPDFTLYFNTATVFFNELLAQYQSQPGPGFLVSTFCFVSCVNTEDILQPVGWYADTGIFYTQDVESII